MDENMQLTINSFRQLFADKTFPLTFPSFLKIPDSCQISRHFHVFQTSGHPANSYISSAVEYFSVCDLNHYRLQVKTEWHSACTSTRPVPYRYI